MVEYKTHDLVFLLELLALIVLLAIQSVCRRKIVDYQIVALLARP